MGVYLHEFSIKAKIDGESLEAHTRACLSVFSSLRECYPDIDRKTGYPDFTGLSSPASFSRFWKSATGFQNRLNGVETWHYRHEILSVRMCYLTGTLISSGLSSRTTKTSMNSYGMPLILPVGSSTNQRSRIALLRSYRTYQDFSGSRMRIPWQTGVSASRPALPVDITGYTGESWNRSSGQVFGVSETRSAGRG